MINAGLFSSARSDLATPQGFFDDLDAEFGFVLDVCATPNTAKCPNYFTEDALELPWYGPAFMNPPYGRQISRWVEKAYNEAQRGVTVVCLLPSRTDTRWWHDYCMKGEIRFIKGRLYFEVDMKPGSRAPFPSAVVVFRDIEEHNE